MFSTDIKIYIREIESGKGEWVNLPFYEDELESVGIRNNKEYEIVDFDNYTGIDISEISNCYYPSLSVCNEFKDYIDRLERNGNLEDFGILVNELGLRDGTEIFEEENYYITRFEPYDKYDLSYIIMDNLRIPSEWQDYIDHDLIIEDFGGDSVNMKEGIMIEISW